MVAFFVLLCFGILWLAISYSDPKSKSKKLRVGNFAAEISNNFETEFGVLSGMRITLDKELPNILLDSKINDDALSSLPFKVSSKQRISLEGDFDKFFDVYAIAGQQIFALSVLTPDVMWTIKNSPGSHDILIFKNTLYIFKKQTRYIKASEEKVLVDIAEKITAQLAQKLKNWTEANQIEVEGKRLDFKVQESFAFGKKRFEASRTVIFIGSIISSIIIVPVIYSTYPDMTLKNTIFLVIFILAILIIPQVIFKQSKR